MASVTFLLNTGKKDRFGKYPIQMIFTDEGKRARISVGEKIEKKDWNKNKQRVRTSYAGSVEINSRLDFLEQEILRLYRIDKIDGKSVNLSKLKESLFDSINKSTKSDFFSLYEQFIEESAAQKAKTLLRPIELHLTTLQIIKILLKKNYYSIVLMKYSIQNYFHFY